MFSIRGTVFFMSHAYLLLQILLRRSHRASRRHLLDAGRVYSLMVSDVQRASRRLAKLGLIERLVDGDLRLTMAGLAVAVTGLDPTPFANECAQHVRANAGEEDAVPTHISHAA